MPNSQKVERVSELKERIEGSTALLLTDYRGLTVSEITELRASLRAGGARFSVIKNTLMRRALDQTDAAGLASLFEGPSAVAFVTDDPVAAAKSVTVAARRFPFLVLKGAFVEGRVLSADEAKALADLESREVMLSKLAGMMKTEIARAASAFQATQARFLSLLEAFKPKLPAEETTAETGATATDSTETETTATEATAADADAPADAMAAGDETDTTTADADAAASDGEE